VKGSEPLAEDHLGGPVVLRDLAIVSVCPHHLLPSLGRATVAYLPGGLLLGLGTVARLVDAFARRLSFQEEIGSNVVAALMEQGRARGAWCRLDMQQLCVCARGTRQAGSLAQSSARAGVFAEAGLGLNWPFWSMRRGATRDDPHHAVSEITPPTRGLAAE